MPWKECNIVEERLRFIARLLDGEKMAYLCLEFGIARRDENLRCQRADPQRCRKIPSRQH